MTDTFFSAASPISAAFQLNLVCEVAGSDTTRFDVAHAVQIDEPLRADAPIAISMSGGRDSQALAYRVAAHLDDVGHRGPRLLVHSDLGHAEWLDSRRVCERVAQRVQMELVVVRREAGDTRRRVAAAVRLTINYTDADEIRERYSALFEQRLALPDPASPPSDE